ncbi:MAG: DUF1844 domain-containing protein [Candidatus Omnitrophota bacterium]
MEENTEKKVDESWKEKAKIEPQTAPQAQEKHEKSERSELPEADFKFFLTTLGMQAWIALGMVPNPIDNKTEENIGQAKFIIDTLEVLQQKTKGNLDKDETELLEHLLYDLRLAFVDKTIDKG